MNNVDDDTIIMMMIMMNGYRKLTKYTPFIQSFNRSMDWTAAFLFLSVLLSVNDELILYDIQHSFAFWISYLSSIDWLNDWMSEWVVCVILKNTTFHPNIELWNHDWYYYELQLSSIKHIRFDSIIIKLINPCFVTHW